MSFKLGLCLKSNTIQLFEFLFVQMFQLQFFCFLFILKHQSIQQCSQSKGSNKGYRTPLVVIVQKTFQTDKECIWESASKTKCTLKKKTSQISACSPSFVVVAVLLSIAKNLQRWYWPTRHHYLWFPRHTQHNAA